jgi:hypothetical protein
LAKKDEKVRGNTAKSVLLAEDASDQLDRASRPDCGQASGSRYESVCASGVKELMTDPGSTAPEPLGSGYPPPPFDDDGPNRGKIRGGGGPGGGQALAEPANPVPAPAPTIPVTWLGGPWPFLKAGFRDFKTNMKRTWPIILVFVAYLFSSASALYGFLRVSAQIPSWLQALYSTWISMSTAGELTTKSSKWVWALGAANSFVGLLFFGFVVWLVTTSLYQPSDSTRK